MTGSTTGEAPTLRALLSRHDADNPMSAAAALPEPDRRALEAFLDSL